jgi:hypothetical protein
VSRAPLDPPRLADAPPDATNVAGLVRSARDLPEPSPGASQLLVWRIRNTIRQQRRIRQRHLRLALVGLLLTVSGGVIGAAVLRYGGALRARGAVPQAAPRAAPLSESTRGGRSWRGPAPAPPPETQLPPPPAQQAAAAPPPVAVALPTAAVPDRRRAAQRLREPPPPPRETPPPVEEVVPPPFAAAPAAAPPAPLTENTLLSRAIRQLRVERDPTATLSSLDDYAARFPLGALRPEAAALRTEALLGLGRKREALRELDELLATPTPRSAEHHLLRGELRSAAGLWPDAVADFDVVLGGDGAAARDPRLVERALWGRATARSHLGTGAAADRGARADLSEYIRRFPDGRHAREAGRLLESAGP